MVDVEKIGTWRASDILVVIDETDGSVVIATIMTPGGMFEFMGDVPPEGSINDGILRFTGVHVLRNKGMSPYGFVDWRKLADAVLEELDCDGCIIEGAARTSGAAQGSRPVFRHKRRIFPQGNTR